MLARQSKVYVLRLALHIEEEPGWRDQILRVCLEEGASAWGLELDGNWEKLNRNGGLDVQKCFQELARSQGTSS